jgi:hypothetical protein
VNITVKLLIGELVEVTVTILLWVNKALIDWLEDNTDVIELVTVGIIVNVIYELLEDNWLLVRDPEYEEESERDWVILEVALNILVLLG